MKDKKEMILKELKDGKKSTRKISILIKANYNRTMDLLKELKREKKVKINREMMGVSWSLR